jgi:hypothetical protein
MEDGRVDFSDKHHNQLEKNKNKNAKKTGLCLTERVRTLAAD